MRKPNRKYKVPKRVMAERLEIGWLNVARVRALCLAVHGYDPEIENWDQSPFHHNESGSQNMTTLAVAGKGAIVPLVEGHSATRERWTANLTTFSNEERLRKEGPPYCEIMFKATAEGPLEQRLWEHVRSRGYGPWVSVTTSEKGSYRQADVLAFLERHLPKVDEPQSRRWRIIMADDYSAHLSPTVFALCWSRRYVFIPHGGGVTPVVQTPDTDLNQHVKRQYTDRETGDLLRQMRDGIVVPQLRQEECIDIMVDVLSNMELHLHAAKGYLKTGLTVDLDGLQDQEIVREAGEFWTELGMRSKINSAVAEIREEHNARRLSWNVEDIQRIILPYPKHEKVDAVLEKMEDDTWIPEGERVYEDEGEGKSDDSEDEVGSEKEPNEEEEEAADLAALAAIGGHGDTEDVRSSGYDGVEDVPSCGELPSIDCATKADALTGSQTLIALLEAAMSSLREVGAQASVAHLQNEVRKEKRRERASSREDPEVLHALALQREQENAAERQRRKMLQEDKKRAVTATQLRDAAAAATALLKKRKKEIEAAEDVLHAKHAAKQFTVEGLGKGATTKRCLDAAKKRRWEVLDRLARLGQGLSPAQRNDFGWFKETWDSRMLQEYGDSWPEVFMGWMQQLLGENEKGVANAFSLFVHNETRRCFDGVPALRVP